MRIKRLVLVAFLMVLYIGPMIFVLSYGPATIATEPNKTKDFSLSASTPWYNENWLYRQSVFINGSSGAGAGYQINLTVTYDSDMQSDFADLLFTDDDGITTLDFWIDSYIAGTSAVVWVEVADDLGTDQDILMYYGNPTCSSTSSGDNTFVMFSDFNRYMDLDTWIRYDASDEFVYVDDVSFGTVDTIGKSEGLAYDGTYYYITTYNYSVSGSESWLYKVNNAFDIVDSEELTDSTLTHSGGICTYNGYLYITMAEPVQNPVNPSKLKRYSASDLSYVDTLIDSSSYSDDHWGAAVIIEELDRIYISNWGTADVYVFEIDGDYVTTITSPPDSAIQDMVYIEEDGLIYGSKFGGSNNIISVWRPDGIGDLLTKVGETVTATDRTKNGFTWYDGYFYTGVAEPDDAGDIYLRKLQGASNNLTIGDYYIYNNTLMGPNLLFEANVNIGGNRKFNMGWSSTVSFTGTQIFLHNTDGNINIYEGNADDDTGFDIEQDTWTTLSIGWIEGNATAFKNRGSGHQTDDVDITGDSLKPQIALWGSADTPIYIKWLFIRNYILDEPAFFSFGDEEDMPDWHIVGSPILYFSVPFDYWALNMSLVFGGLILMLVSACLMARKVRDRTIMRDSMMILLLLFFVGWGLFIGGTIIG